MFKKTTTTKTQNEEKHDNVIATPYFILFLGFFYNTSPFHPGTSSYKKKSKGRTSGRETYNHIIIITTTLVLVIIIIMETLFVFLDVQL